MTLDKASKMLKNYCSQICERMNPRRLLGDISGVSAIEFALILPVQLLLLFGTVEIANILIADRKTASVASAIADLVAQAKTIDDAGVADVFTAAQAMMQPFDPANISIVIVSVTANGAGVTTVAWSDAVNGVAKAAGAPYALPPGLVSPNMSVIIAEVEYAYHSDLDQLITAGVTLKDKFFLAPRRSVSVVRL